MKRYLLNKTSQLLLLLLFLQTNSFGQVFSSFSYPGPQTYTLGIPIPTLGPSVSGGPAAAGGNTTQAFAGSGSAGSADGTGAAASFNNPLNTAVDAEGNIYIADAGNHRIRKITADGNVTTFAGSGLPGYADATGVLASFRHPSALAVDGAGNVYVSDQQNHRVRKITPAGVVTTLAGSGSAGFADGTGTAASFSSPIGLALDGTGNLYVADYSNNRIRKITSAGVVTTYAGTGTAGMTNGAALSATFRNPMGLAFDATGNLFVADRINHAIRKITSAGTVSTLAGSGVAGSADGTGTSATFNEPNNLVADAAGNIYVADRINNMIRKVTAAGVVTAFAGTTASATVNGTGTVIRFVTPYGLGIDKQGNIYIAQNTTNLIRKVVTQPYNIYPQLPAGLSFGNTNGQISGIPAVAQSPRTYYIQAFNTTHSSSVAALVIGVSSLPAGITGSSNQNYIATYIPQNDTYSTAVAAISASANKDNVQTTIQYFDGLGRTMQSVQVMGSNDGLKDIVVPVEYDDLGRVKKSFLPYMATTANGSYKTDALTYVGTFYNTASTNRVVTAYPFSLPVYEPSPLNRIAEQGAPGVSWQPVTGSTAGHTQKMVYTVNTAADTVKYWTISSTTVSTSASYAAGQLTKTISKDENWVSGNQGTVEEYKDMEGNVVCKRVWESNTVARSTHYVYDEYNRLRYVIPPKVTATSLTEGGAPQFKELVYAYHYDAKGRLMEKKIPGKGWEEFVYDKLDRLTMSRDTVQRIAGKWLFTKYDGVGRVAYTGRITSTATRATHQTALDGASYVYCQRDNTNSTGTGSGYTSTSLPSTVGAEIYTVNYYDDYLFWGNPYGGPTGTQSTAVKGLLTGTRVNTLPAGSTLITANYYDGKGQLIQNKSNNLLSGTDVANIAYNFNGSVKNTVRIHSVGSPGTITTITTRYKYDHMGRKLTTKMQLTTAPPSPAPAIVGPEIMISKLEYNAIGQLYKKYLHSTDSSTWLQNTSYRYNERGWLKRQLSAQFSMKLSYDSTANIQYNGNIARQEFGAAASFPNTFSYAYDKLNRLTNGTSTGIVMSEAMSYDANGNILSMNRDGAGAGTYSYVNGGNRLNSISGGGLAAGSYAYDFNGNATTDGRTGITMSYNVLNLPATAIRAASPAVNIAYTYDAAGNKLRKAVTAPGTSTRTYVSGIEYDGSSIDIIQTEEGIVRNSGGTYTYEYNLSDHLGNVRYSFYRHPSTGVLTRLQSDDYYPFGKRKSSGSPVSLVNKYLYNGKEIQDELDGTTGQGGEYDYGARFYDPVVGRWNVIDNKAEKYISSSPYHYTGNNPARYYDIDGNEFSDSAWDWVKKLMEEIRKRQESNSKSIADKRNQLAKGGLSERKIKGLNREIGNLESNNSALEQVKGETAVMAASKQMYNVVESSASGNADSDVAATSFNFKTGAVDITISPTAGLNLFAHELLHGYQFETGLISLTSLGASAPLFLLDKTDEKAGYLRQGLFGQTYNSLPSIYSKHPDDSRTIYNFSYKEQSIADLMKQGNVEQLKNLSKIMKQAYRVNIGGSWQTLTP